MEPIDYLEKLKDYYAKNGISYKNLRDSNTDNPNKCNKCQVDDKFRGADTFVGSKYGHYLIKLVFVSSDVGNIKPKEVSDYEFEGRRKCLENQDLCLKTPHIRITNKITRMIYGVNDRIALEHCCLINVTKCCVGVKNKEEAPGDFFNKCKEHVIKEIEILKPNIIITQGKRADESIDEEQRKPLDKETASEILYKMPQDFKKELLPNFVGTLKGIEGMDKCFIVYTYHPSHGWFDKKNKYYRYCEALNAVKTILTAPNSGCLSTID